MSTHEVITIQAGHYANFVGTHWWNMQEASFCYTKNDGRPLDMNHDVLFREGLNPQKEITYTPRLIVIDTKASLKTLKQEGTLYDVADEDKEEILWDGPSAVIQKETEEKNFFLKSLDDGNSQPLTGESLLGKSEMIAQTQLQNLENAVHVWSDFLRIHLHPRSILLIDEYYVNGDESSFETYGCGAEAYNKVTQDIFEDKLRQYVEECDYLQGFHVIADGNNGFCAIGSCILQHLEDEYQKRAKVVFPVYGKHNEQIPVKEEKANLLHRMYSTVLGFNSFSNLSSFFSPLSLASDLLYSNGPHVHFPLLSYKPALQYHTSAVLAATLEGLTSSYRLKARKFLMSDIADSIVLYGRKVVSSGICIPFPLQDGKYFPSLTGNRLDCFKVTPVTPCFEPHLHRSLAQSAVLRGIIEKKFHSLIAQSSENTENLFGRYLNVYSPSALTFVSVSQEKCAVSAPFPNICTNKNVQNLEDCFVDRSIGNIAIATTLSNSNDASDMLEKLLVEAKKRINHAQPNSVGSHYEDDDFSEVLQNLIALKENYGPNYSV